MGSKFLFSLISLTFLFSCTERSESGVSTQNTEKSRLFAIKKIQILPYVGVKVKRQGYEHFFEITLHNTSDFELNLHAYRGFPFSGAGCLEYDNYPSTAECYSLDDTCRLIEKNQEFIVHAPLMISKSQFRSYQYQDVEFTVFISSPHDLTFYFEQTPSELTPSSAGLYGEMNKYRYPFKFTYWVPADLFYEH